MMGGFGDFGTFGWIGMILNWVITIGLIVGVVLLIVWLVKRLSPSGQGTTTTSATASGSPRDILQIRYARGEITREQYQQMLADLGQ
ncbi:MAG TPA: SHOCT domain-containing protein [Anaerolineae bacterium]|nr:SHOCT domain-containing protein [Anaerolineae bacterium]